MAIYYYKINGIVCTTDDVKHIPAGTDYQTANDLTPSDLLTLKPSNTLTQDYLLYFQKSLKNFLNTNKSKYLSKANAPYTDSNGIIWNGGQSSVSSLNNIVQSAQILGQTNLTIFDLANQPHVLTIAEVQNIAANINMSYQADMLVYQSVKNLIMEYLALSYWKANNSYSVLNTLVGDYQKNIWKNTTTGTSLNNETIFPLSPTSGSTIEEGNIIWSFVGTFDSVLTDIQNKLGL